MTEKDKPIGGNLVPAGHDDLARVASANPLVSRAMADLAKIQELPNVSGGASDVEGVRVKGRLAARPLTDIEAIEKVTREVYGKALRYLKLSLQETREEKQPGAQATLNGQIEAEPCGNDGGMA